MLGRSRGIRLIVILPLEVFLVLEVKRKVPRCILGEKSSKDMANSRNLVSTIGAQASRKLSKHKSFKPDQNLNFVSFNTPNTVKET